MPPISEINGTYTSGITIDGVAYASPFTIDSTATVTNLGGYNAVSAAYNGATTVINAGTISGAGGFSTGIDLYGSLGGTPTIVNLAGGIISGSYNGVLIGNSPNGTVDNSGTISGGSSGVALRSDEGAIFNRAGGVIIGGSYTGVYVNAYHHATLENAGTIDGSANDSAVVLHAQSGARLIVDPGAVFIGSVTASNFNTAPNVLELKAGGAGTLDGLGSHYVGFQTVTIDSGATWDIKGSLAGLDGATIHGFTNRDSLDITDKNFASGDTVSFNSGTGILTIRDGGGGLIGTVQLDGGISGDFHIADDGNGHIAITDSITQISGAVDAGITLTTAAYATSLTITNTGTVSGSGDGLMAATGWTIVNQGTIDVTGTGIDLDGGGSLSNSGSIGGGLGVRTGDGMGYLGTIDNSGTITGSSGSGVALGDGGSLTNEVGGYIGGTNYGVVGRGTSSTIENAGTIAGGTQSVYLDGATTNRLIVDAGAVFTGDVVAQATAANTLELKAGGTGTLDGLGSHYVGFQTVTIDSGAAWDIKGSLAGIDAATIQGFNGHDTLDIIDQGFAAGDTVSFDSVSHILSISDGDGSLIGTVQLDGSVSGDSAFHIADDGNGHIALTESIAQISGAFGAGVVLTPGAYADPLTITNTGTVSGSGDGLSAATGWTIVNQGIIDVTGTGIDLRGGSNTIENAGTIAGGTASVYLGGATNRLIVDAGAVFTGYVSASGTGANTLELSNTGPGAIYGIGTQFTGFQTLTIDSGATWNIGTITAPIDVRNDGTISGGSYGLDLRTGGTVTNSASGAITGGNGGVYIRHFGTIVNHGSIGGDASRGVNLHGGVVSNDGTISGGQFGVYMTQGYALGNSVTNAAGGTISGGIAGIGDTYGVSTVRNAGAISGGYYGVRLGGTNATLENSGIITGGTHAVYMNAATTNRLIVDAGAVFDGDILATGGANTLELSSLTGAGTIDGIGTHFTGFQTLTIDSGATWTIGTITATTDVQNAGTLTGADYGLDLTAGGSLTNAEAGSISGGAGVEVGGGYGLVLNSGTIVGTTGTGVELDAGGSVTNSGTGVISGFAYGVKIDGAAGTVVNSATITATDSSNSYGVGLRDGGTVINSTGGTISAARYGIYIKGDTGTVDNSGTIAGTDNGFGTGVALAAGGDVTNEIGGTITGGFDGVYLHAAGTVINHGSIGGGAGVELGNGGLVSNDGSIVGSEYSIYLDNGGSVSNAAGGTIYASLGSAIQVTGSAGSIDNAGSISGADIGIDLEQGGSAVNHGTGSVAGYSYGVRIVGAAGTIDNSGIIKSTGGNTTGAYLGEGGTITNEAGGTIAGTTAGVLVGSFTGSVTAIISNDGSIDGGSGIGVSVFGDGSLINLAEGSISGGATGVFLFGPTGTVENAGAISGGQIGVVLNTYSASVGNSGAISGGYEGVVLNHGGAITNVAGGTITGISVGGGPATIDNAGTIGSGHGQFADGMGGYTIASTYGVVMGDGTLLNEHTGTIDGGIAGVYATSLYTGNATVENAGTITGGTHAVNLNATITNRLIVDAGAVFNGDVVANATAANTIEMTSHATAGTLSGLGTQYRNFQTVHIDAGAQWTIGGTEAGIGTTTIQGFNTNDTLDITDLTFASGDTVHINDTTDVLTILAADGTTVLDTIQLAGNFAGKFFHLSDDGTHGSYITEDSTACYCRGTLILTDKGDVPVETLKIGDRLLTHWGAARPIRWIGTRSYDGRFAAGNRNVLPVRIKAGALAGNVPRRDLFVSPLHAMFIDGVLVPAYALINGTSIVQATSVEKIEYFHLELDSHDVILAEGALSETFLDDDSREMFQNATEYRRLYPNAKRKIAEYCAPMIEDGPELEAIRGRIAVRAAWMRAA